MFDYSMMDNVNRIIAEGATKTISKENFIRHEIDEYLSSKILVITIGFNPSFILYKVFINKLYISL